MGLEALFDDVPLAQPASAQGRPASAFDDLFADVPITANAPARLRDVGGFAPVVDLEGGATRSGGAGVDRLIGTDTGMLSGAQSYEAKRAALEAADAEVRRRSQVNTDLRAAPTSEFVQPNPLFEMGAAQREAEARRTGVPVPVSPMEPVIDQAQQGEMNRQGEIDRSAAGFDAALAERNKINVGQPQSQDPLRNAGETAAAALVGIPAGVVDAAAIVGKKIASDEGAARVDEINKIVQQYANGLARPDPTQADSLIASKIPQGLGSTFGFGIVGQIGRLAGLSSTATTALAGALPQAASMYRDAEVKGASETQKNLAFLAGLGLGSTEAIPIAKAMDRWATQTGGYHRAFRDSMISIAEEATQEFGQQLGENAAAKALYDPNRPLTQGVAEGALVGGITGGALGGAGSFANAALRGNASEIDVPLPPGAGPADQIASPIGVPAAPEGVPQGAVNAEVLFGPDPGAAFDDVPAERPSARLGLRDVINDPRPVADIRAEMEAGGQLPDPMSPEERQAERAARRASFSKEYDITDPFGAQTDGEVRRIIVIRNPDNNSITLVDKNDPTFSIDATPLANLTDEQIVATRVGDHGNGQQPDVSKVRAVNQGDGSRAAPVAITTAADVTHAADRTAPPTPAQAEAGNYRKRHVDWNGLDISIETEAGGERSGVAPDGKPWSVTLPTPYGYIKRTKGADGDHLDVYVGPAPQGQVFVVDQIDPKTGKFDEHKVMLGFTDEAQAQAYYEAAFSDGNGPSRAGAVTPMTTAQFKQWVANGNLKKPIAYKPAPVIKPRAAPSTPGDILRFIAGRGGIKADQAAELADIQKVFVPGYGKIARPTGNTLDETREAAIEAGYLPEGASINDLLAAIDWSTRGRKTYSTEDQAEVAARQEQDQAKETDAANSRLLDAIRGAAAEYDLKVTDDDLRRAAMLLTDGMDYVDALERLFESDATEILADTTEGILSPEEYAYVYELNPDAADYGRYLRDQQRAQQARADAAQGRESGQGDAGREEAARPQAGEQSGKAAEPVDDGLSALFDDVPGQQQDATFPPDRGDVSRETPAEPVAPKAIEEWFKGSKILNDEGTGPLVVHHFTYNDFETFDRQWAAQNLKRDPEGIDTIGSWFTDNASARYVNPEWGGKRIDVVLQIKKPLYLDDEAGDGQSDSFTQLQGMVKEAGGSTALRERLQSQGYDGIVFTGTQLDGVRQNAMIAFEPEQIRRAPQNLRKPVEEKGADDKPQLVIPGAERIGQGEQAQRAADKALKPKVEQKEAGGLFGDDASSPQLFDDVPAARPQTLIDKVSTEPPKSQGLANIKAKREPQKVGENRFGDPVFEAADGKRSYISNGITLEQGDGDLTDAFRTRAEAETQRATDTAGTIEERIERYKAQDKTWAEVLDLIDSKALPLAELQRAAKLWNRGKPTPPKSAGLAKIKEKAAAKATEPAETDKRLGFNDDAFPLFEDARGVRYYVKGGVKVFEKVQLRPTREGMRIAVDHKRDPEFERVPQRGDFIEEVKAELERRKRETDEAYYGRVNDAYWPLAGTAKGNEFFDQARKALEPLTDFSYIPLTKRKSDGIRSAGISLRETPIGWTWGADYSSANSGAGSTALELERRERIYPTRNAAGQAAGARMIQGLQNSAPASELKALQAAIDNEFPPGPPTPAAARRESLETGAPPIEDARETQRRENVAKAEAAGFPLTAGGKGATNTVFTADAAAKARARLKAKLSGTQLNSGIDPETVQDGITLAGYHIEAGARSFAAYTKAMIEDLGETVRPYLRGWYEAVRYYPGFNAEGMSTAAEIEAGETAPATTVEPRGQRLATPEEAEAANIRISGEWQPPAKPPVRVKGRDQLAAMGVLRDQSSERPAIAEAFRQAFIDGRGFKTIREARKTAEEATEGRLAPNIDTAKMIDEAIELGVVLAARDIVAEGKSPAETFDRLVDLYGRQPSLSVRTSTSMIEQAYSTPVPLAYVASQLAGITGETRVYEPSAGNGALLIAADPSKVWANELNKDRAAALRLQGFNVSVRDATERDGQIRDIDVVIENPPFGVVRDEQNNAIRYDLGDGYKTNEVDHAIVMRSLAQMNDDGRAVLIIGGINKLNTSEEARSNAYNGKAKREFFFNLYGQYNVVDHFVVAGELYQKQGAGWPVDVIVIEGRGKSALSLPAASVPRQISSWADMRSLADGRTAEARQAGRSADRPAVEGTGTRGADAAGRGAVPQRGTAGPVTGRADPAGRGPDVVRDGSDRGQLELGGKAEPAPRSVRAGENRTDRAAADRSADVDLFSNEAAAETDTVIQSHRTPKPKETDKVDITAAQTPYRPQSSQKGMNTLVPGNMQTTTRDALANLEERVGNIDSFVAKELGYERARLGEYFAAEQVDGIALAIDAFKKDAGFIVGDQTGIGKGRQVAGVLRWAMRNNLTPIFVTEKPNLYADMFRDLSDIGIEEMLGREMKLLMTNSGESISLTEDGKRKLKSLDAKKQSDLLNGLAAKGKAEGYDLVFTTYSQMQTVKGQETDRMRFLRAIAGNNAVVTFDETHNAGGQVLKGRNGESKEAGAKDMNRAIFARELTKLAKAVLYSSATYAKRPDVMDLYYKTDMRYAVDDASKLGDLIAKGGVPMQQIVATMLSKAGQYVRRERSFDGIRYDSPTIPVDRAAYERFSKSLKQIQEFSEKYVKAATKAMDKRLKAEAKSINLDNATGSAGASSTNFTSIMHNVIGQMLLAIKADSAADEAIASLRNGEKAVITVASTLESFLANYAEDNGVTIGQPVELGFDSLLDRYLERSRWISIKPPNGGESYKLRLTDADLGPVGVQAFRRAEKTIQNANLGTLPVSPIDWMKKRIRDAGFTVGEITGRGLIVDYRDDGTMALANRPGKEMSIEGRRSAIRDYNAGKMDVMILNQAGSTGLSIHASEKVADQRPRHMIIGQAEQNIDTHMQMLGRVNRTGQVVLPRYSQIVADVPAEKRPASVLAKKMASLNANTTASRTSAVTAKDVPDFMNVYGDLVAARIMNDNPEIHEDLGNPLGAGDNPRDDAMRKVTGRIPLLPLAEQEALYALLEGEYEAFIEQLNASGQNALEAKTLELDARTVDKKQVKESKAGIDSPFAEGVDFETVDVKRLGKPMSSAQVIAGIAKAMGVSVPDRNDGRGKLEHLAGTGRGLMKDITADATRRFNSYKTDILLNIEEDADKAKAQTKLDGIRDGWNAIAREVPPGAGIKLLTDGGSFYGIVLDTKQNGKTKNPLAHGDWKVTIALADSARQITVPFSQLYTAGQNLKDDQRDGKIEVQGNVSRIGDMPLLEAFDDMQTERREERTMVTGNILSGYEFVNGKGSIVNFTDSDGNLRQGIFMPRDFDPKKTIESKPVAFKNTADIVRFLDKVPRGFVQSTDNHISVRMTDRGNIRIDVASARADGGKYYLNRSVIDAFGRDFVKTGSTMSIAPSSVQAPRVLDALQRAGASFQTVTNRTEALGIVGAASQFEASAAPQQGPMEANLADGGGRVLMNTTEMNRLATIVAEVAGDVGVSFPQSLEFKADSVPGKAWGMTQDFEAAGAYNFVRDAVYISRTIGDAHTAYHEAFHRLQTRALTQAEQGVLKAALPKLREAVKARFPDAGNMSQREVEAEAFALYATARDKNEFPRGIPAQLRQIWAKLYKIVDAVRNALRGMGYQTSDDIFERAYSGKMVEAADRGEGGSPGGLMEASVPPTKGTQDTLENRQNLMVKFITDGQPVDRAFRLLFDVFGGLDRDNRWNPGVKLDKIAEHVIVDAKIDPNGRFGWLASPIENARRGLIDRYGLDPAYVKRDRARANDERAVLTEGREILEDLLKRDMSPEEAKTLQRMLTGEEISAGEFGKLAEPIRIAIDQLGAEAVSLGLLSAESFERNRGAYLHRVYMKDVQDQNRLSKMVDRIMTSRRKRIIGDQFKGRGIFMDVAMARLLQDDPEFRDAKRGPAVKGEKFKMIQRITEQVTTDGEVQERETKRIWWPADRPIPAKWQAYRDAGTWEVRGVSGGKAVLWRDYTKDERTRMGEIVDARYTIGKTYQLMAHDLANGKFFKDVAENEDWTQSVEPAQPWMEASKFSRAWNDLSVEWVKVPDEAIANSGGKKRWGALSGKYVRAEIWRDLNETAIMQNPSIWRRLYQIWKINKTARSPVTHMNNIMSNVMFADMADIRLRDIKRGIESFFRKDAAYREAAQHGAFGADMVSMEFSKEVLQPLLDELQAQQSANGASNPWFAKAAFLGKMTDIVWNAVKKGDQAMLDAYRIEDEVFRMATYVKRREMGDSPQDAADFARRQFLDYDIKAPWIAAARNTIIPFISYTYRAAPLIAQAMAHRPWKLAKYYTLYYAANALAYGLDADGDEERERASLRKDEQGKMWTGSPRMIRMPWRDANGLPVFLDARRWNPAGDIFDAGQGSSALPILAPLNPGGPIMLAAEFFLNKQAFTGKTITNELTDTWMDKGSKIGDWAWKSTMPNAPWVPGSWSGERIRKAWVGGTDRAGNPLSMKEALASSIGVKVAGRDIDQGFGFKQYEFRKQQRDLQDQMRALSRQRSQNIISQKEFDSEMADIITKRQKVANDAAELGKKMQPKAEREKEAAQ